MIICTYLSVFYYISQSKTNHTIMATGPIPNDTDSAPLVHAMLEALSDPACIFRIDEGNISIYMANDRFIGLPGAKSLSGSLPAADDVYPEGEMLSAVRAGLLGAAMDRGANKRVMRLRFSDHASPEKEYRVENVFLFSRDKSAYVLHRLGAGDRGAPEAPAPVGWEEARTGLPQPASGTFVVLDHHLSISEFSPKGRIFAEKCLGLHLEKGRPILSYVRERRPEPAPGGHQDIPGDRMELEALIVSGPNGVEKKIGISCRPLFSVEGRVTGISVSARQLYGNPGSDAMPAAGDADLSVIYNHLSETVFLVTVEDDGRFRFASVNRAFLTSTGLGEAAVVGRLAEEVIPEPHLQAALAQYRQAAATGLPVTREETAEYPSGTRISLITVSPYFGPAGKCTKLIGSIQDITGRVTAEKKVLENMEKIQSILDASPDIICTLDREGVLHNVSAASERMLGYPPGSLVQRRLLDLVPPEYRQPTTEFLERVVRGEDTAAFENELIGKNGNALPVIWSAHWNPSEMRIYCTVREAKEKRLAERLLAESEKRFKALVHDGSDMIAILDGTANYLYVSPSSKSVLDLEPEMFLGRSAFEFIHPEDIEKAKREFASAAGQKKVQLSPFRFMHNNGSWRWVQTVVTDLSETPAIRGFVANSRDVTDIVESQKALESSNERYRYVSRATTDAIWDYDIAKGTLLWGEGFLKMFGYSEELLCSDILTWNRLIHPADAERVEKKLRDFFVSAETNWRDDYRFLKADGNYAHVVDKGFVVRDSLGVPVRMIGAMQDITVRKKEEARLRVLESVVTNTIDAVIIAQMRPGGGDMGRIVFVNGAFERMTGYRSGEAEGRSPWFLQGPGSDGSELERLSGSILKNVSYQGTLVNYKKNGGEMWVNYSVTPVADGQGAYTHWVAILRDVTLDKTREQRQSLLTELSDIFNREKGLRDAEAAVLSTVCGFGKFDYAALWANDASSGELEPAPSEYYPSRGEPRAGGRDRGSGGRKYALQVRNNGIQGHWKAARNGDALLPEIRQVWGIPLYHYGSLIGVLLLGRKDDRDRSISALPENLGEHLGTELHRKKLEQDLEHIFSLAPDIIAITDFSGRFKKLNPAASNLLGYGTEELLSRPFGDFLHPEEKPREPGQLSRLRESGKSYYIEERYRTRDGRSKWLAWTSLPLEQEGLIYSVAKDITEKKELEQLLLDSNSLARIGSWELSFPEKKAAWSAITREILHAGPDYVPLREAPLGAFYPEAAAELMHRRIASAIDTGTPWDEVLQVRTLSGVLKWVRSIGSTERIDGRCLRVFGSLQDIDAQVRAESSEREARSALEESERRYSGLFHLSPLPMWVYDYETLDFLDVNQTAVASYGYGKEEFLSMNIRDIRPPEEIGRLERTLRETRKQEGAVFRGIFRHRKKNGEIIQVDIKSNTIVFKGRRAKVIIASDITERLRQFQAIESRNEKLREIAWIQSHRLRAPLAKLMGLVRMLYARAAQVQGMEKILEYIDASAEELDRVVREVVAKSEELDKPDL